MVTFIIFFRFEDEMIRLQKSAMMGRDAEISKWKAFVAAFFLGVSNLRRRRLRTALTCATLIILTFTIMSFTAVKSSRLQNRILYRPETPYKGFLLKSVNWQSLPPEALGIVENSFKGKGVAVPRVWRETEDRTRAAGLPVTRGDKSFEAQGLVGLSHREPQVTGLDEILTGGRWLAEDERFAALIPERMAATLGIDPEHPDGAAIGLWGNTYNVVGVFFGGKAVCQDRPGRRALDSRHISQGIGRRGTHRGRNGRHGVRRGRPRFSKPVLPRSRRLDRDRAAQNVDGRGRKIESRFRALAFGRKRRDGSRPVWWTGSACRFFPGKRTAPICIMPAIL